VRRRWLRKGFLKSVFILNDPPYGTERFYNALRLLNALMKKAENTEVTVFLIADAVIGASPWTRPERSPAENRRSWSCIMARARRLGL
jgi:sulfur relay (sulfurtransferase) complex TusBCD TusD component (DsrE family)